MKYLFVAGAPRSGTSALTELLSSHPDIAIGMERFKFLYGKKLVKKDLFIGDEFFNFNQLQTNINCEEGKYVDYYRTLKVKYDKCSIVGDKYPQIYNFWPSLFEEFGAVGKYIFIIRDIDDVASSFNVRAQNPKDKWPKENDYKKAVSVWNQSLIKASSALKNGSNICIISYSKLFDSELFECEKELSRVLDYLDLGVNELILDEHLQMCKKYINSIKSKEKLIMKGQADYIKANANIELYTQFMVDILGKI